MCLVLWVDTNPDLENDVLRVCLQQEFVNDLDRVPLAERDSL